MSDDQRLGQRHDDTVALQKLKSARAHAVLILAKREAALVNFADTPKISLSLMVMSSTKDKSHMSFGHILGHGQHLGDLPDRAGFESDPWEATVAEFPDEGDGVVMIRHVA